MTNHQSINQNEETNMSTIEKLFQEFQEAGGEPKVTEFKKYIDQLINTEIKQLCGRSSKSVGSSDWKDEVKERFGGTGSKWVKVSIEEIMPTLASFGETPDVVAYTNWIAKAGYAWIRYAKPKIENGVHMVAFEVRTTGSKNDQPKHLHLIPMSELDDKIESLGGTPFKLNLEEELLTVAKRGGSKAKELEDEIHAKIEAMDPAFNGLDDEEGQSDEELFEELYEECCDDDEDFDAAF